MEDVKEEEKNVSVGPKRKTGPKPKEDANSLAANLTKKKGKKVMSEEDIDPFNNATNFSGSKAKLVKDSDDSTNSEENHKDKAEKTKGVFEENKLTNLIKSG